MRKLLLALIRGYQRFISPVLPPSCRFRPTCSAYAWEAIDRFGALHGSWLALKRVLRCHPLHPGGYDPVPPFRSNVRSNPARQESPPKLWIVGETSLAEAIEWNESTKTH